MTSFSLNSKVQAYHPFHSLRPYEAARLCTAALSPPRETSSGSENSPLPPEPPDPPGARVLSPPPFSAEMNPNHHLPPSATVSLIPEMRSSFSCLTRSNLLCFPSDTARLTVLNIFSVCLIVLCLSSCSASLMPLTNIAANRNHLIDPFVSVRHSITTVILFPPPSLFTVVLPLAKLIHLSDVFPGGDLQQCNLGALLNLWAWPIISRSSFTIFMHLCSGGYVFMRFNVTFTGSSSARLSSDFADLVSGVPPTYRRISKPTSTVLEYRQPTGASLNLHLSLMEIDSKRSIVLTTSQAIPLVRLFSTEQELRIVFKTILEALLKKLPVFIFDLNCLTYPGIALYFISASSCFYSLAKSYSGKTMVIYTMEDLLKVLAETLGRGTLGSTYKAVMESMWLVEVLIYDTYVAFK
ncbi:unnamed protein product [Microthlaspi erraticum]|uniref:Uncharacterized protein n=1 Tax=Microthlaspi erraticum TaxID=1685480 RepID=A0A6D2IDC6_9BRAS|nr:unnamed protein product [Microthlaspi erraticum]